MKEKKDKRDLISSRYSPIFGNDWLEKGEGNSYQVFRINTSLYTKDSFLSTLDLIVKEKVFWINDTIFIFKNESKEYVSHLSYESGFIFNLSSFMPVFQLDISDKSNILDICAAPGVKSSQIILNALDHKMNISITSCEKDTKRFHNMNTFLRNLFPSSDNLKSINIDSRKLNLSMLYDEVLCDAPCSAEGEMVKDINYLRWNSKLINSYTNLQKSILAKAISLTKSGGKIVYSTCTLSPEENEEIVDWALKRFDIDLEEVNLPDFGEYSPKIKKGILNWGIKNYDKRIEKTIRIIPDQIYEGFFISVIRKK